MPGIMHAPPSPHSPCIRLFSACLIRQQAELHSQALGFWRPVCVCVEPELSLYFHFFLKKNRFFFGGSK
jgi:hypothetical protein